MQRDDDSDGNDTSGDDDEMIHTTASELNVNFSERL